jgi:hypothetical protein
LGRRGAFLIEIAGTGSAMTAIVNAVCRAFKDANRFGLGPLPLQSKKGEVTYSVSRNCGCI